MKPEDSAPGPQRNYAAGSYSHPAEYAQHGQRTAEERIEGLEHALGRLEKRLELAEKPKAPITEREPAVINSTVLGVILAVAAFAGIQVSEVDLTGIETSVATLVPLLLSIWQGLKTRNQVYPPANVPDRMPSKGQ